MRAAVAVAGCLTALAAGCAPLDSGPNGPRPVRHAGLDPAETLLVEAVSRAEAALTTLARIRVAETGQATVQVPRDVPPELRRPVTLDWIGPAETLAKTLAARAGYDFAVAGPRPPRPFMVTVTADRRALIDVLRDAGLQLGGTATLTVDAGEREVLLDWAPAPVPAPLPSETPPAPEHR